MKKSRTVAKVKIKYYIYTLLFLLSLIISVLFAAADLSPLCFVVLWGICVILALGYLPLFFSSRSVLKNGDETVIVRGVFIKRTLILPDTRVLVTKTVLTPLMRIFRVHLICFIFAGGRLFLLEEK